MFIKELASILLTLYLAFVICLFGVYRSDKILSDLITSSELQEVVEDIEDGFNFLKMITDNVVYLTTKDMFEFVKKFIDLIDNVLKVLNLK